MQLKIGIIGLGYWGNILFKYFSNHPYFKIKWVCDRNEDKRQKLVSCTETLLATSNPTILFDDNELDAVVIATQASTHYELCRAALLAKKHVFVEKPFVVQNEHALELCELSKQMDRKIFVDHTFLFTEAYQHLKQLLQNQHLGKIFRIFSERTHFGLFPKDINVVWNMMYHDIYLLTDMMGCLPSSVFCQGTSQVVRNLMDGACAVFNYAEQQIQATVVCDLNFPQKNRRFIIQCEKGMIQWDETDKHPLKLFNQYAHYNSQGRIEYHGNGEPEIIPLQGQSALNHVLDEFYNHIVHSQDVACDGMAAHKIVQIIESIHYA